MLYETLSLLSACLQTDKAPFWSIPGSPIQTVGSSDIAEEEGLTDVFSDKDAFEGINEKLRRYLEDLPRLNGWLGDDERAEP